MTAPTPPDPALIADLVAVCPVCQRPVPTFEPGEVGPFCTPITCSAWKVTETFNYETRQWEAVHTDG